MSKNKKKKKNKVTYIDDGRTIVDMSGTQNKSPYSYDSYGRRRASFKEQFQTYKQSVKMMFIPMLVTIAAISVIFLILYIVFELAA